ncbi:MAG: hypothetical protein KatS3mg077_1107 [Candidatus Binatia bacterium]|nr:MAG: hypothetical protein KatS3mg077_1107 [Candidatus Binatia bacterium]
MFRVVSALPVLALLSRSWQLLQQNGANSAELLEHVLDGKPSGKGPLGRWLDRRFLLHRHWQGVRSLYDVTRDQLASFMEKRWRYGVDTFVLDLGHGSARYAWALLDQAPHLSVLCLRRSPREVDTGRHLTRQRFGERLQFSIGDRLDAASYLTQREPDAVVCLLPASVLGGPTSIERFFEFTFRALAPGGIFWFGPFSTPEPRWPTRIPPLHIEPLVRLLESAGFQRIRIFSPVANSPLLRALKPGAPALSCGP